MKNTANIAELSEKKISVLLWQYALPAIVGTVVNTLYNIIDGVFVGHWIGKEALSALGIVLPVMILISAVGMMIGSGSASRMSISLGMQDRERCERIAGVSFVLSIGLMSIVVLTVYIFLKPILMLAGASEVTYPYARDFMHVYLPGNVFLSLCFNFNNMMRASGYPRKAMITMLIGVFANILLAPLFILVLKMGMRGAAMATCISMFISLIFVMHHFLNRRSYIKLRWRHITLRRQGEIVKSIISIGLSPFCMQVASSVLVIFLNMQLRRYAPTDDTTGDDAIAAFSNINRLLMLVGMIIIGMTQGMQPIVGYNYGAKNYKRVKATLVYTIKMASIIACTGFVLSQLFPRFFVQAFTADPQLIRISAEAMRYATLGLLLVGAQMVISNFFQSIGKATKSIFLSLTRQFIFYLPCLYLLPHFWGLKGVWLSMSTSDILAAFVAFAVIGHQIRAFNRDMAKQTL